MKINRLLGFTLIELMIAVVVVAILLVGGSMVLFGTLGSRGQNQADQNINLAGSQAMEALEQSVRFSVIEGVGGFTRQTCLAASSVGVSGSNLLVSDSFGTTNYALDSERIASVSGSTKYISTPDVVASNLSFTWLCVSGGSDKLRIVFDMDDPAITGEVLKRTFRRDINMYNSGI